MSSIATEVATQSALADEASSDLTVLGKRLEILRIHRGLSKQGLARHAGTSRQQLWRVMTGKSDLTTSLKQRLAAALAVEVVSIAPATGDHAEPAHAHYTPTLAPAVSVADYLSDPQHLATTLRTLPAGDAGRRLKRALLNAVEDLAVETGHALPAAYSEIHRRVLGGEL